MAQTIKIKRTTGVGKPTSVAQGELFYAYDSSDAGGTYSKRLAIGHVNGGGNTPEIIGGKVFMDMLDHTAGQLTASSALIADSNSRLDEIRLAGQGEVKLYDSDSSNYASIKAPATISSNFTLTLPADDGSSGQVLQTNGSGVLSWAAVGGTLTIDDASSTQDVSLTADDLQFLGTANEITTAVTKVSNDVKVTIGLPDDVTIGQHLTVTGNLTVNGTTTTVSTTNTVVEDALLELGNGTSGSPSNDAGIIVERGSADNVFFGWDESEDKFRVATTSNTGASTGNLTLTTATLLANLDGNVTSSSATITGGSVTGITDIVVADGGTGVSTFTSNGILYGNGTSALQVTAAGTDGYFLYSNSGTPAWTNTLDGGTYT